MRKIVYLLLLLSSNWGWVQAVKFLLWIGVDPNTPLKSGVCALFNASWRGNVEMVNVLLSAGANPNGATDIGFTVLMAATICGHAEVAEILLSAGANPNSAYYGDDHHLVEPGDTALMLAGNYGQHRIANVLLSAGANLHTTNNFGNTALHRAASQKTPEVVFLLLSAGANLHAKNNFENTPLHKAVWHKNAEIVNILLSAGANPNETGVLFFAKHFGTPEIVRILEEAIAKESGCQTKGDEKSQYQHAETGRVDAELREKRAHDNAESLYRRAMQKVHPDRAPKHLQEMCEKLAAELNAARKAGDYKKIAEIAKAVGVSLEDDE